MGHAAEQVAEESQHQRRQQRRCAHNNGHGQERRIHGAHVGRVAGKEVVAVEVNQRQNQEGDDPVIAADHVTHALAEPGDQAQGIELGRHHNQSGKPDQGIPGAALIENIVPVEDGGEQEYGEANKSGRGGVHTQLIGAENPE